MPQVYNWLKGCFPRGILPTDIDGEVEINGHFLRMEFKHESALRNGSLPKGQHMALRALIKTNAFTVVLIGTCDMGEPTCYEAWFENGKISKLKDCDKDSLREFFSKWSKYAEGNK